MVGTSPLRISYQILCCNAWWRYTLQGGALYVFAGKQQNDPLTAKLSRLSTRSQKNFFKRLKLAAVHPHHSAAPPYCTTVGTRVKFNGANGPQRNKILGRWLISGRWSTQAECEDWTRPLILMWRFLSPSHRDRGLVGVLAAHYSAACTTVYHY